MRLGRNPSLQSPPGDRRAPGGSSALLARLRRASGWILLCAALAMAHPLAADSPILTASPGNVTFTVGGPAVVVDPALTVTGVSDVNGARVEIAPFVAGDVLSYTGPLPGSVSASYNASTGVLTFSNTATTAQWQALLRTVTFSPSGSSTPRTISFTMGIAIPYNGHFYEFVTDSGIAWTTARTNAAAKSLYGLQGYLATVTSAEENDFCTQKLSGTGWIGASDAAVEGEWRWVTGPEGFENAGAGRLFWLGDSSGSAQGGYYNHWYTGEPNNSGDEDYAHFYASGGQKGYWNDFANTTAVAGYLVEYGGMPGDPVLQITGSKTVDVRSGYTVTFQTDGAPGTTLTGTTSQTVAHGGSTTAVTANPTSCWHFVNWTGTGGFTPTTSNPLTVSNVTSDLTVTANFSINTYALQYLAGPNGFLSGSTLQVVECGSSGTAVTAQGTPGSTYSFLTWSDGSVMNPRTDANVTANLSVTATFATQEIEPNNSFTQATWVSGPGLCVGRINPAGLPTDPSDYYRVVLPQGAILTAVLAPPPGTRYYLYLYNQMGRVVAQGTSSIAFRHPGVGAQSYYVVVRTVTVGASNPAYYQLTLDWSPVLNLGGPAY